MTNFPPWKIMSQPLTEGVRCPTSVYFWWIREADSLASNHLWWSMDGPWDFLIGFSHWATPAATSDWWIFCSQSCACLSSLSPWTACQGWIWKKYTFQSEDLWVLCSFWIPAKFGHWHWTSASKTTHRHLWTSVLRSRPLPAIYVLNWLLADVPPISKPLKPDVKQHGMRSMQLLHALIPSPSGLKCKSHVCVVCSENFIQISTSSSSQIRTSPYIYDLYSFAMFRLANSK